MFNCYTTTALYAITSICSLFNVFDIVAKCKCSGSVFLGELATFPPLSIDRSLIWQSMLLQIQFIINFINYILGWKYLYHH